MAPPEVEDSLFVEEHPLSGTLRRRINCPGLDQSANDFGLSLLRDEFVDLLRYWLNFVPKLQAENAETLQLCCVELSQSSVPPVGRGEEKLHIQTECVWCVFAPQGMGIFASCGIPFLACSPLLQLRGFEASRLGSCHTKSLNEPIEPHEIHQNPTKLA